MKQFGLSENFIYMDDDYFIAKPINKSEMFYEENGKIYPSIITSNYYELDKYFLTYRQKKFIRKKNILKIPIHSLDFLSDKKILRYFYMIYLEMMIQDSVKN